MRLTARQAPHGAPRRQPVLDVDTLIDDPDTGSSSAAAPAASARRRPPPRSRCARPSAAAGSSSSPSTPPGGWPSRWGSRELDNTPRPVAARIDAGGGRLDAMMLDMKRTFDEVIEAHADPGEGRADLREPLLPGHVVLASPARRSTWRWRSSASCRRPPSDLGPDRRRHPAEPVGARLPRRARAARLASSTGGSSGCSSAPPRPAAGLPAWSFARVGIVTGRAQQAAGGADPQGRADVRRRAGHRVRRASGSGPSQTYGCCRRPGRRSSWSPRPSRDALREASYFVERLAAERMPLAGLVLNRVHRPGRGAVGGAGAGGRGGPGVARRARADGRPAADPRRPDAAGRERERRLAARFMSAVPAGARGRGARAGAGRARPRGAARGGSPPGHPLASRRPTGSAVPLEAAAPAGSAVPPGAPPRWDAVRRSAAYRETAVSGRREITVPADRAPGTRGRRAFPAREMPLDMRLRLAPGASRRGSRELAGDHLIIRSYSALAVSSRPATRPHSAAGAAALGARARSSRPRPRTRSGCPARRRGTPSGTGHDMHIVLARFCAAP